MVFIRNAVVNAQALCVSSRLNGVLRALRGTTTIMSSKDGSRSAEFASREDGCDIFRTLLANARQVPDRIFLAVADDVNDAFW
jgi:hypothetical protein